jgi:Tol biopolymer transport system component
LPASVNVSTSTFAPSVTADGSLYFMRPDERTGHFRLFRARMVDGAYSPPVALPFSDGSVTDVDPVVAPDQSFMVFGSGRKPARSIDLFIAFSVRDSWSTPQHLGDVLNSEGSDAEPRLGPDSRTLYFSSERLADMPAGGARPPWDNGKYNIWRASLAPWLDCQHHVAAPCTAAPR